MRGRERSETGSQGGESAALTGSLTPQASMSTQCGRTAVAGDSRWAMVPRRRPEAAAICSTSFCGRKISAATDSTRGDRHVRPGKSEYFLSLCNRIALTHLPETFIVIFVDMKFESAPGPRRPPHVAGLLSNLGKDDRHLAERMRKAIDL